MFSLHRRTRETESALIKCKLAFEQEFESVQQELESATGTKVSGAVENFNTSII